MHKESQNLKPKKVENWGYRSVLFEETNQLLEPEYTPLETGYSLLPNSQMHVAILTRLPGCNWEMIDWWFGHLDGTEKYKTWHPKSHLTLE